MYYNSSLALDCVAFSSIVTSQFTPSLSEVTPIASPSRSPEDWMGPHRYACDDQLQQHRRQRRDSNDVPWDNIMEVIVMDVEVRFLDGFVDDAVEELRTDR